MLLFSSISVSIAQSLRVATINMWSGLTYEGSTSVRSFETPEQRSGRLQSLLEGCRAAGPDIIALQEVNPAGPVSGWIASALGYDVIYQRVLAGIKVGPVGLPWNLNEGLAILARPDLQLAFVDVLPLSSGFGAFGDVLSFHIAEENAALIGSVRTSSGEEIIIVNLHLPAYPDDAPQTLELLSAMRNEEGRTEEEVSSLFTTLDRLNAERREMLDKLLGTLDQRYGGTPLILLGDFNLGDSSSGIASIETRPGYAHAIPVDRDRFPTWDGTSNPHIRTEGQQRPRTPDAPMVNELDRLLDQQPRALDHIFVRTPIGGDRILRVERILDEPYDGIFASDHYGMQATIDVSGLVRTDEPDPSTIDLLPIASYDDDVGFGYGIKLFFLDQFGTRESFDVIAFNSSKGERWYRLVWSMPDFELRQGTLYPYAIDVTFDYDRFLRSAFFGIGQDARFGDKEEYTKEVFQTQVLISRGLSRQFVAQAGIQYRRIRHSNFGDTSAIPLLAQALSSGTATALSLQTTFRYDTRDSYVNPSRGLVLQGDVDYAPSVGSVSFGHIGGSVQYYATLMYPKTVFAARVWARTLVGPEVPLQFLLPLGGNRTLRGYPENRLYGRTTIVSTAEVRFPLIWRFGGILGYDIGNVWMSPDHVGLSGWRSNTAVGARFHMDTFIVRADLGFSSETSGFYLNFGHIF